MDTPTADDLEIGEVGLPQRVRSDRLVLEFDGAALTTTKTGLVGRPWASVRLACLWPSVATTPAQAAAGASQSQTNL